MAKKMKLAEKSQEELTKMLKESRESLRGLRFSAAGSRPKDAAEPKKTRKQIARVLTEITNRAKSK